MANKEKEQFVVQDRRKFTAEGELRPDAPPAREENAAQPKQSEPPQATEAAPGTEGEAMPAPPSAAEQHAQHTDYKAAGKQIDSMLDAAGAKRPPDMEMTFEKLVLSLYMTAMMQLGMVREEETPARPDIVSARQTIDTISLLGEKTKGNLTERESHMLQNCLFELRMAFLEIMKVLTTAPPPEKK
ncbi:MAG TPA: DUF1844 domain-containing protein [Terriglobales bacterium]|nr:DUF1844 domain-containing protein [Terriglobales bacterium]